ncbi:DUF1631 domain-containing protein [Pseudomaricurvus sp.]|uniref:DUF1631 domain-containing protein n=1 Tax=Pseudomaricurvus sp. TaxID=2004510 RepID=UPI003F6C54A2
MGQKTVFDDSQNSNTAKKVAANNVVSIGGSGQATPERRPAQVSLARLPAPVHRVREKASTLFQQTLRNLFDGADDALFDLADKATSNQDQNTYFEAMREVRLKRRETEKHFFLNLDKAYSDLLRVVPENDNGFAQNLTLDDLTLVDNDQLEFQVAVESMIAKVLDQCAESAQHIALRLDSLVPAKVYQQNNPVGPDVLCNSFWRVVEPLDVDIKAKLVLLKLFDKAVMAQLSKIYTVLNDVLIQQNVLPSLTTQADRRQRRQEASRTAQRAPASSRQAASPHNQRQPEQGQSVAQESYGNDGVQEPVLEQLRHLLAPVSGSGVSTGSAVQQNPAQPSQGHYSQGQQGQGASAGGSASVSAYELASVLTSLQQNHVPQVTLAQPGPANLMDAEQLTQLMQQPLGGEKALSAVDQDVMNLINMLFQFILDDRNLAAPMQSLLARLQIPMLKVAVVDKSFFNRSAHPARRLLNELATAALGWQEPEKGLEKDPLFKKVASVVETVISDFDEDVSIFDGLLTDFLAFIEKEHRRATVLEKRTLDAEDGKAKSEYARSKVSEQLQSQIGDRELPQCVSNILEEPWHNLMFLLLLKNGKDSDAWKNACQVVDDLVWSVTGIVDVEARKQLMAMLPGLLKRLRQGFEVISYNPFEANKLLQQLEAEHLLRMRGQSEKPQAPVAAVSQDVLAETAEAETTAPVEDDAPLKEVRAEAVAVADPAVEDVPAEQNQAETVSAEPVPVEAKTETKTEAAPAEPVVSAAWLGQVDRFTQGSWFEVAEGGRPVFRCRLAAVIKKVDKFIFVNRNGMKVAEKTRVELAQALEEGTFSILDDGMLFDRALESVIGNLRESRGKLA